MSRLLAVCILLGMAPVLMAQESSPLPAGALRRFGTDQFRHGNHIACARFSPNGRWLASGGGADPVRIWDVATGRQVHELKDPWVNDLIFSSRGNRIVTVSAFKTIKEWDLASGSVVAELKGHEAAVTTMAISRDNTLLATADQAGDIIVWELFLSPRQLHRLGGHTGEIRALAFSPDGRIVASASSDRSIRLWEADSGNPLHVLDGGCCLTALAFLADGRLASAGDDHLVRIWDVAAGRQTAAWSGHDDTVVSLVVGGDGKLLVSGGRDGKMRVWNTTDGKTLRVIDRDPGDSDALALSPDDKVLVSAGANNTIRRWDTKTGAELSPAKVHRSPVAGLALSPDGTTLASAARGGDIRLWDLRRGEQRRHWHGPAGEVRLAFSPDGKTLATLSETAGLSLLDATGAAKPTSFPVEKDDLFLSLAFAPDGKSVALGLRSGAIRIVELTQAQARPRELKYDGPVYALAWSPDGKTLAAAGGNDVVLFDDAGKEIGRLAPKESALQPAAACLAFSPDGKLLMTGSFDSMIRLWDIATGQMLRTIEGHTSAVQSAAFSPDGRHIASAGFDGTARLWETFGGRAVAMWRGHRGPVTSVIISNDGRLVASGGADTSILVWDVTGKSPDGTLPMTQLATPELKSAWQALASLNAGEANGAVWDMVRAAPDSIPFAEKTIFLLDHERLTGLIMDLDSAMFLVREKASVELAKYGRWIEPALEARNKQPGSEEVRRRIIRLLDRLKETGALTHEQEVLRFRRVMLMLEQNGGVEARALLQKMSTNAPEGYLQEEARASLQRLAARNK